MVDYDELADVLKGEVLTEMAKGFFGARKAIDTEVELFEAREADLLLAGQRALCLYRLLHMLLHEGEAAEEFLQLLNIDRSIIALSEGQSPCLYLEIPFALTRKGRFVKLFAAVYAAVQEAFVAYAHGLEYRRQGDPVPRRTMGWNRYVELCREVNEHIEDVNRAHAPSCVMGMARSFEVEKQQQQEAMGGAIAGMDRSLDCSMCLPCLTIHGRGYGELPYWPDPKDVRSQLRAFAESLYNADPERAEAAMKRMAEEVCV